MVVRDAESARGLLADVSIGFRASMGTCALDPGMAPPPVAPHEVASLASRASLRSDAHLVKDTSAVTTRR